MQERPVDCSRGLVWDELRFFLLVFLWLCGCDCKAAWEMWFPWMPGEDDGMDLVPTQPHCLC